MTWSGHQESDLKRIRKPDRGEVDFSNIIKLKRLIQRQSAVVQPEAHETVGVSDDSWVCGFEARVLAASLINSWPDCTLAHSSSWRR
jgi:hypothetical protein